MQRAIARLIALCLAYAAPAAVADDTAAAAGDDAAAAGDDTVVEGPVDTTPRPFRWSLDAALGGGSVLGLDDGLSTGHTFWGGLWFNWSDFGAGLVVFGAYPDSRVQTRFAGMLFDFRWYFLGEVTVLRPYAAIGLGFTAGDSLDGRTNVVDPVRWSPDGSPFVVAPAVGLRWGQVDGLFVTAEARLINVSHLSFALGAGFSF